VGSNRPRGPQNRQRERVLQLVREHDGPADAAELAAQLDLHVTTVRFHLDALCDQGALTRTRIARTGVGRPRTGYIAVRDRLDYRSLAEILALELGDTAQQRLRRAERAGYRWAERITAGLAPETVAAQASSDVLDRRVLMTAQVFQRMGFEPQLTRPAKAVDGVRMRTMRLHACPVRELAADHPEVGCALHRGLLTGLLADPKTPARSALHTELEPFVEPQLCIATVSRRD
jgi:predicted ArsR family transcriptional regulator